MSVVSGLLAERVGVDPERAELIGVAAALHDVGTLAVPEAILNAPGPLTASDRSMVESHARIGHRILAGSGEPLLDLGAVMALTHHERVDGSGYPNRLRGEDIPLEGRIAAVADVFDALLSDRSYRSALGLDEAMWVIAKGRGTLFDARVVDALSGDLAEIMAAVERAPVASPAPVEDLPSTESPDDRVQTTADQIAANLDQTGADADDTASRADQAASDADQALADRDQSASDRDQATADREHLRAGRSLAGRLAYEESRAERTTSSQTRESTAAERLRTTAERLAAAARRDEVARVRDLTATIRDRTADVRDAAAEARDRTAERREREAARHGTLYEVADPLREMRSFSAAVRRRATSPRRRCAGRTSGCRGPSRTTRAAPS